MPDALAAIAEQVATVAAAAAPARFTLASPTMLATATALALGCVFVAIARRISMPRGAAILMTAGLACVCLAAGGLTWQRRHWGHVAVVVDLSPSTGQATFHQQHLLDARIKQLLGSTPFTLYQLADGVTRAPSQSPRDLPGQLNCRETLYAPPDTADAVVLFSDAQFTAPRPSTTTAPTLSSSPPQTFVVIDPALERPNDAAIERLEMRGEQVVATLRNPGDDGSRHLMVFGTDITSARVPSGRSVITGKLTPGGPRDLIALFRQRDAWVGNDILAARVPPPPVAQRWWIGNAAPPSAAWVHVKPADAPADLADYLAAGVVVIDNVAADAIPETPRERMQQYVRDLGGGIVILGGDRAFAAGGYAGTPLEALSPLASTPPRPAAQWLLLADSSGSMARTLGDNSRWNFAVQAIGQVIPRLPPDDTIAVGNFSQALRWWIAGVPVRDAQANGVRYPKELRPHGPTNLAAALRLIADTADGALPTQLLLITDAEAKIDNAAALGDALAMKRVSVSVLATEKLAAGNPLQAVAQRTNGRIVGQGDPRQWARELKGLMRAASPPWLERDTLIVRPTDAGPRFATQRVTPWNRTWLKRDATELAEGASGADGASGTGAAAGGVGNVPAIAAWNVGSGAVISAAFRPPPDLAQALADRVAAPPRDPRFRVTYDAARALRVTLDAIDNKADGARGSYMNNLAPRLELSHDATRASHTVAMPQIAPGRYELSLPAPSMPMFASVRLNGRVIDRFAVAGRYPPEFEQIGNNRAAMTALAASSGGAVIEPSHTTPLDFRRATRPVPLATALAALGAACIAAGLVRWRM
jgi:hypothetical protein